MNQVTAVKSQEIKDSMQPRGCYEVHASCLNMLAIMRQAKAT
jgi:hypothetical protein